MEPKLQQRAVGIVVLLILLVSLGLLLFKRPLLPGFPLDSQVRSLQGVQKNLVDTSQNSVNPEAKPRWQATQALPSEGSSPVLIAPSIAESQLISGQSPTGNKDQGLAQLVPKSTPVRAHPSQSTHPNPVPPLTITPINPRSSTTNTWVVQLASFHDQKRADRLTQQLRAQGFKAYAQQCRTPTGLMTRVLIGPKAERKQAYALQAQLKQVMHLNGIVIAS